MLRWIVLIVFLSMITNLIMAVMAETTVRGLLLLTP